MGNGAKAAMKRDRNAAAAKKGPTSQLASNAKAMNTKCKICMQVFLSTVRRPALAEHATNKHSKAVEECFDDLPAA